jgi:2-oxoglutarate dehydrogenase complex, dehydrogenase (E1) component, and related enzymes
VIIIKMSDLLESLRRSSPFYDGNAPFIESLYESWLQDPGSVPEEWRKRFESLPQVDGYSGRDPSHRQIQQNFRRLGRERRPCAPLAATRRWPPWPPPSRPRCCG